VPRDPTIREEQIRMLPEGNTERTLGPESPPPCRGAHQDAPQRVRGLEAQDDSNPRGVGQDPEEHSELASRTNRFVS
jgi:hypothetical protein